MENRCNGITGKQLEPVIEIPSEEILLVNYDEVEYIAPDEPYKIASAKPGKWTFEFIPFSDEEITEIMLEADILKDDISIDRIRSAQRALVNYVITTMPSPISLESQIYTNNPMELFELIGDIDGVAVYENGSPINISEPMNEGLHNLTVIRIIGDSKSKETFTQVVVDTVAPTITYLTESFETESDGILLSAEFSDDVTEICLNGEQYLIFDWNGVSEFYYLEVGDTDVTIEIRDIAGNTTTETVTLTRLA
jgi:hypothetical protein